MKGHKQVVNKTTLGAALDGAKSEVECLRDEMEEWQSGMEGTGLENTQKYEDVTTAYDECESAVNELEQVELEGTPAAEKEITFTEFNAYGKRSNSRGTRCMNVCSAVTAIKEGLEAQAEEVQEAMDDTDVELDSDKVNTHYAELVDQHTTLEEQAENVQGALGYLESVEFPGMYG